MATAKKKIELSDRDDDLFSENFTLHIHSGRVQLRPTGWIGPGGLEFPAERLDELHQLIGKVLK